MLIDKDFYDNRYFHGAELMHREIDHLTQIVLDGIAGGVFNYGPGFGCCDMKNYLGRQYTLAN
jgi:hypothetical protein